MEREATNAFIGGNVELQLQERREIQRERSLSMPDITVNPVRVVIILPAVWLVEIGDIMWFEILKSTIPKELQRALAERGYEIVEMGEKGGRHYQPTIMELSTGRTIRIPISGDVVRNKANSRSIKNVVTQVIAKFKGRARRGQGEFKLSENDIEEHWTDILKGD